MTSSKLINNTYRVKLTNTALIRKTLKENPPMTRAEISRSTGLSIATCRNILTEMVESNEIIEIDSTLEGSVGRPAKRYAYNGDFSYVAAIILHCDGTGRHAHSVVANLNGDIVQHNKFTITGEVRIEAMQDHLDLIFEKYPEIRSLAIALPGTYDHEGRLIFCDYHELDGVQIIEPFASRYNLDVVVSSTSALLAYGYPKEENSIDGRVFVALLAPEGYPQGVGIVSDNRLFRGDSGLAGEVAFMDFGPEKNDSFQALVTSATAAITLLGPKALLCGGERFTKEVFDELVKRCQNVLNPSFWPEFILVEDHMPYLIKGAIHLAIDAENKTVQVMA